MWPFSRKSSPADAAIAETPLAVDRACSKWLECQKLPFRENVDLFTKATAFSMPFGEGLRQRSAFKDAPDALVFLFIDLGIEKSGTHSRDEIEAAFGAKLP
jgi:hypothetical protein